MRVNGLLLFGIGVLVGMELAKRKQTPPDNQTTPPPITVKQYRTDYQVNPARVGALDFFQSYLTGARPDHPYQVRWGSGNQYLDTTKKAQMVI